MKNIKILSILFLASIFFTSCEEEIMEWEERSEEQRITTAEIPLELEEKISRYDALKTYSDYVLGAGIILDLYMNDENYRSIVNENFDEVTVGYAMKHGAMVNADGEINFEPIDDFIALTNQSGLSVYGHTLNWHANQNASYLNSLIAPTIIPGSSGANILDRSALEDGTFTGWPKNNPGDGITIVENAGLGSDSPAIELIAGSGASEPFNLQLATPDIPIVQGNEYEVSFYIKSDQPGQGRISFSGLENNYPYKDWYNTGEGTEAFETTSEWQQVTFTVSDFTDTSFGFFFDLGYVPGVTYYIDVATISVVDPNTGSETVNLISNGDFEGGNLDGWNGYGNESTRAVSAQGEGYGNTGYAMVLTNPAEAELYSAQQVFALNEPLEEGTEYTYSFYVKADVPATVQVQIQGGTAQYSGPIDIGTTWTQIERTFTPTAGNNSFVFDFGLTPATVFIDDVVLTSGEIATGSETVVIEMSDEEKAEIIGDALEHWISGMVTRYKDDVTAWDVVNEPMKEGGSLRDGNVTDLASDDFYWVKYLGKDYAVTAFKLAREYGNPSDILFINDYNLEASLAKLDGLIEFTQYIESQGATVDGIGTQMHVSLTTSRENIVEMFQKMAATGKQIKVSELDVRLGTASPTTDQLTQQADMYQFIIDSYREYVPSSQQYGITLWNISDNEQEHEFWLPDESPNVWDANYERKPAYKGVADGLAGRDVSEDFTGELE
ncbi:endo-1,4-beta-xylanase [Salegentibacter sp. Hel_I_6]|uniref:endo-1,4-beta-xylanase n=1 Tax=Salegentibacter sp. Hel_I_6 TaxID=1250278 RepID=UPI000569A1C2|nr:endo-1,4-beta-xylanase [Salegentibacter sp. Hel_I_6]